MNDYINWERCYSELIKIPNYEDRFNYLRLESNVGDETFGGHRKLNQIFYKSSDWKRIRNYIIARDLGCDLGSEGYEILNAGKQSDIIIHHINPINEYDILNRSKKLLDPENLITTRKRTHNAIHYGIDEAEPVIILRHKNDMKLW